MRNIVRHNNSKYMALKLNDKLLDAIRYGNPIEVERLLKAGAETDGPETKDSIRRNALMLASWYGYKEIVEILLRYNADINAKTSYGWTALLWALRNGATSTAHKETVEILLEAGIDVSCKNDNGDKAIHFAKSVVIISALIDYGADPAAVGSNNQNLLQKLKSKGEAYQDLTRYLVEVCGVPDE
jgi:ankyrin repeat protein